MSLHKARTARVCPQRDRTVGSSFNKPAAARGGCQPDTAHHPDRMPRFFDDYSNTYLTHDSAAGRKQQRRGWKFRENFRVRQVQRHCLVFQSAFTFALVPIQYRGATRHSNVAILSFHLFLAPLWETPWGVAFGSHGHGSGSAGLSAGADFSSWWWWSPTSSRRLDRGGWRRNQNKVLRSWRERETAMGSSWLQAPSRWGGNEYGRANEHGWLARSTSRRLRGAVPPVRPPARTVWWRTSWSSSPRRPGWSAPQRPSTPTTPWRFPWRTRPASTRVPPSFRFVSGWQLPSPRTSSAPARELPTPTTRRIYPTAPWGTSSPTPPWSYAPPRPLRWKRASIWFQ